MKKICFFSQILTFCIITFCVSCSEEDKGIGPNQGRNTSGSVDISVKGNIVFDLKSAKCDYWCELSSPRKRTLTAFFSGKDSLYIYSFCLKIIILDPGDKTTYNVSELSEVPEFKLWVEMKDTLGKYTYDEYYKDRSGTIIFTELTDSSMKGSFDLTAYSLLENVKPAYLIGVIDVYNKE